VSNDPVMISKACPVLTSFGRVQDLGELPQKRVIVGVVPELSDNEHGIVSGIVLEAAVCWSTSPSAKKTLVKQIRNARTSWEMAYS
jgi:hypothetical protein